MWKRLASAASLRASLESFDQRSEVRGMFGFRRQTKALTTSEREETSEECLLPLRLLPFIRNSNLICPSERCLPPVAPPRNHGNSTVGANVCEKSPLRCHRGPAHPLNANRYVLVVA